MLNVAGAGELDPRCNGRLGGVALLWILVTNLLGCIIGAVLCLLIKPGTVLVLSKLKK